MMRRFTISSLAAGLVLSTVALPAAAQDPAEVTILHDTHFHGSFGDDEVQREACPGPVPAPGFDDVSTTSHHYANIACAAALDIVRGTSVSPPLFSPGRAATRAQIAALLARMLEDAGVELPTDAEQPFSDVSGTHANDIARLAAVGIVRGHADGTFRPLQPVMRDQMAALLIRTVEIVMDWEITPEGGPYFDDVEGSTHEDDINAAYEFDLMFGKTDGSFDPRRSTRRDQVASTVVRLSDLLAEIDAFGLVNISRYFSLVEERKVAHGGNALFLGNGDDIAPSLMSGVFDTPAHGIHMVEALNASGLVDVNTFGNHEFDYGPGNVRTLLGVAEYPYVSANVREASDNTKVFGADQGAQAFQIFEVDGVQVGVTGLAPKNMDQVTNLDGEAVQIDAETALLEVVPDMKAAGAELIVVTSHLCGTDAIALADSLPGGTVDVIAGDHCAAVRAEPYVSATGTIVSLAGDEQDLLGELTLTVVAGEVTDHSFTLHDLAGDFPLIAPHAAVQDVVDKWSAMVDEELNVVIGERTVDWDTRTTVIRANESALGNFVTDEMRVLANSDIALTNSGGLRGNTVYPAGDVTKREIAEILPFGNKLVEAQVTGEMIWDALEHSVGNYPDPAGKFLQVSGLTFEFDPSQPAGSRVVSVTLEGGAAIPNDGSTYTMATNDFMLGGGDGYTMFAGAPVTVDSNSGPVLDTYLMQRIEARGGTPITTDVAGRINITP